MTQGEMSFPIDNTSIVFFLVSEFLASLVLLVTQSDISSSVLSLIRAKLRKQQ